MINSSEKMYTIMVVIFYNTHNVLETKPNKTRPNKLKIAGDYDKKFVFHNKNTVYMKYE